MDIFNHNDSCMIQYNKTTGTYQILQPLESRWRNSHCLSWLPYKSPPFRTCRHLRFMWLGQHFIIPITTGLGCHPLINPKQPVGLFSSLTYEASWTFQPKGHSTPKSTKPELMASLRWCHASKFNNNNPTTDHWGDATGLKLNIVK